MGPLTRIWTATWTAVSWLTFSPGTPSESLRGVEQFPLASAIVSPHTTVVPDVTPTRINVLAATTTPDPPPFEFKPGSGNPNDDFLCDYSNMPEWSSCSTPENRECWLRHPDGREFNIHTDYEKYSPTGIDRYYTLNVTKGTWNADGRPFDFAKLFNNTYPGPWLQACWGDTIHVNVTNYLPYNGTSIHWHGIRQWLTMHMDGVNGVTQCPIAPNDYFVYKFKALQYGSSWYHSHYSVQYADGMQGPITIHGPASAPFDLPASKPLLMTDWDHTPAFSVVYNSSFSNYSSIALNGKGNVTRFRGVEKAKGLEIPKPYTLNFEQRDPNKVGRAKRYLLRLINTSFDTTFVFSIDNHWIQVIGADFVPIEPYYTTSVLVGIGQRYNVIVEANPVPYDLKRPLPTDPKKLNFWIRTQIASCRGGLPKGTDPKEYMKTGILRYDANSDTEPVTEPWDPIPTACSDEPYESLIPKLPQTVGSPVNGLRGESFGIRLNTSWTKELFPLAKFSLGDQPLRIDYSDPIFNHLDNYNASAHPGWVVIPEEYNSTDWVWILFDGTKYGGSFGAHPMHLHGHDFAILQVSKNPLNSTNFKPNRNNPPRRDVVLLPSNGFAVIAFKADNPGSWLVHCHIAFHASEGLAMQILERLGDANAIWPKGNSKALAEADRVCKNWKTWQSNTGNYAPGVDAKWFQDDSGI